MSKIFRNNLIRIICFAGFAFVLFLFPSPNIYFQTFSSNFTSGDSFNIDLPSPPPIPINITGAVVPDLTAEGVLIIDLPSYMIIHEKNADEKFHPASTTKIITALVALDHFQLDDILTVGRVETEGRVMGLVSGEKLTFESLLYGALVHSANDAAYAIAENYPGGVEKFVEAMNRKTVALHLDNTHFNNPIGFDDDQTYTTPKDLAKLAKVALSNKLVAKIVSTKSITVSDSDFTYFHALTNVNELLGKVAGVAGVKTGYTESGGEILVSEVKKNGRSVLFVVLKSVDRFKETKDLIDWVFGNFAWKNITEIIPANH
ncbi:D-alanyl-D-alanine carboxypeptidase [Candidatus Gottesmanbacteria bacterium]|nr:D-alanyl-D-alanine carboxypeptidase [Candidatus Gottesmanbacteria bacterium]